MKTALWLVVVLGVCLGLTAGAASAAVVLEENFDYPAGALLTANGWIAHSGAGTQPITVSSPGLSYTGYPSSGIGNAALVDNNGEDDHRSITPQSSGTLYYGFLLRAVTPTLGYFTHLHQSSTIFAGRVFAQPAAGGMNIGISNTATAPTFPETVYALNTTHLIVVKFDFATGMADLFVNPSVGGVEPSPIQTSLTAAAGFTVNAVSLRQYATSQNFVVDGIRVGTTWTDVVGNTPNPGACCSQDGSCSVVTQAGCGAAGGDYRGDGTSCPPTPACPPAGACCIGTTCTFVLQASCAGTWTEGGACSPNPCSIPTGSCCALDGSCSVSTEADCAATWTSGGVCTPNICAQPTGSCCASSGACTVTAQAECTDTWTLSGVCVPNTCPVAAGACCSPSEVCTVATAGACTAGGGAYQGDGTGCSPSPCGARLRIVHLDTGQGDAAVLFSPGGEVVLFDTGDSGTGIMGVSVLGQLQALGVTHVDYHFQSHYHADHLSNVDEIVNGGIPIYSAWDRGTANQPSTGVYNTYVSTISAVRHTMAANQVITLDAGATHPVTIKCVTPNGGGIATSDENYMSMVLKVSYGEFGEVFGGDLQSGSSVEATVGPMVGEVEVYKVHHHGSANASSAAWLTATQPKVGVVSVGDGNSYGHPTAPALTALHNANVRTYWTETGSGVAPNPTWDHVSNGQVKISATWQPAGVDTIRGNGFVDTFINSGAAGDVTAPSITLNAPNGGETWYATVQMNHVAWTASDDVGVTAIDLEVSVDGGQTFAYVIATGLPNTGSYDFVPELPLTDRARVRAIAHDAAGNLGSDTSDTDFTIIADVSAIAGTLPGPGEILGVYPNPAAPGSVRILCRPAPGGIAEVSVYDVRGRLVRRLGEGSIAGGVRALRWDGADETGRVAPAGMYVVRLTTNSGVHQAKSLVLVR
jgi:beta-lactamase superfamily II metal-dependent hydrolase